MSRKKHYLHEKHENTTKVVTNSTLHNFFYIILWWNELKWVEVSRDKVYFNFTDAGCARVLRRIWQWIVFVLMNKFSYFFVLKQFLLAMKWSTECFLIVLKISRAEQCRNVGKPPKKQGNKILSNWFSLNFELNWKSFSSPVTIWPKLSSSVLFVW